MTILHLFVSQKKKKSKEKSVTTDIKNSLEGFKSIFEEAEKSLSELEYGSVKVSKPEK